VAIPDYQSFMLPLLRRLGDGKPHKLADILADLADDLKIPEDDRHEVLRSGVNTIRSRAGWAQVYLKEAGLLTRPSRGLLAISEEGLRVLATNPSTIDNKFLASYPSFLEFQHRSRPPRSGVSPVPVAPSPSAETPDEQMERLWQERRDLVARDLLQRIAAMDPAGFESLVVRVLVAIGYGGSYAEAASVVGRSGDAGIDGIIKEDRLGLDAVYIQAKRWQGVVGRPEIQRFSGSLDGARASKGVFITTSSFTPDARSYVRGIGKHIVLIDGPMLADLMIEYGVGVVTERTYVVPKVDLDFFEAP
jgi:restriction system protein